MGSPLGVEVNVLDCDTLISEFEFQSLYYSRTRILGKSWTNLSLPAMSAKEAPVSFFNHGFSI